MPIHSIDNQTANLQIPATVPPAKSSNTVLQYVKSILGMGNNRSPEEPWQTEGKALYRMSQSCSESQPCNASSPLKQTLSAAYLELVTFITHVTQSMPRTTAQTVTMAENTEPHQRVTSHLRAERAASPFLPPTPPLCEQRLLEEMPPPAALTQGPSDDLLPQINLDIDAMLKEHHCVEPHASLSLTQLITSVITFSAQNDQSRLVLVRTIQRARGHYGEWTNEPLSQVHQHNIIRFWVSKNIFGQHLTTFLRRSIIEHPKKYGVEAFPYSTQDMKNDLRDRLSQHFKTAGQDKVVSDWIWSNVVLRELPVLRFQGHINTLTPESYEWGQYHAGLSFAQDAGYDITTISLQDALTFGQILLAQTQEGMAPSAQYFRLPSLLRYAQTTPDASPPHPYNLSNELQFEEAALRHYLTTHQRHLDENDPVSAFQKAIDHYQTRSQLAQQIIDDRCPGMGVNTYLNLGEGFCRLTPHHRPYSDPQYLENIDKKYEAHIDHIATAYEALDMLLVTAAWSSLDDKELEFIYSATVRRAGGTLSAADALNYHVVRANQAAVEGLTLRLASGVELFSATKGNEPERIYALRVQNDHYALDRVDHRETHYHQLGLFEKKQQLPQATYRLVVSAYGDSLKHNADLTALLSQITQLHKNQFRKALFEYGLNKTPLEQAKAIGLSLLPFYTCITEAQRGNQQEAALACTLDALMLMSVIGNLGSSSLKASQIIRNGIWHSRMTAAREIALKHSLRQTLKATGLTMFQQTYAGLTDTANSGVRAFSLATLRAIDPGFELTGIVGKKTIQGMLALGEKMAKTQPAAMRVWQKLAASIKTQPDVVTPEIRYAFWRDIEVPVTSINTREYIRGEPPQELVVKIDPSTGERLGPKLVIINNKLSMPVRLKNIHTQGLGGKGAPQQGKVWAHEHQATERGAQQSVDKGLSDVSAGEAPSPPLDLTNPQSKDLLNHWEQWVKKAPHGSTEKRDEALQRIQAYLRNQSTTLNLSYLDLTSLPDLLPANMQQLVITGNSLHELPRFLSALTHLHVEHNQLTSLGENLPDTLQELYAAGNHLTKLPKTLPHKLTILNVSENSLKMLPDILPDSIALMDISQNQLTRLPRTLPNSLMTLIAQKNHLQELSQDLPDQLTHIDISFNTLSNLPARLPPRLVMLDVSDNALQQFTPALPESLISLYLRGNQLESLPEHLPPDLMMLDADENALTRLPDGITQLSQQARIHVYYNHFSSEMLQTWDQKISAPTYQGPKIEFIEPASNDALETWLNIAHTSREQRSNAVKIIRSCAKNANPHLDLSNLQLASLPALLPSHITKLTVSKNNLQTLPENLPKNLRILNAEENELITLPKLPLLETMDVSFNELTNLDNGLPSTLRSLKILDNKLRFLPERLPNNLELLQVSFNQLERIPEHFPENIKLVFLVHNKLTALPQNWPDSIQTLDLQHNGLTHLNDGVARLSYRAEVLVNNNPLSLEMKKKLHHPPENSPFFNHKIQFSDPPTPTLMDRFPVFKRPANTPVSDIHAGTGIPKNSAGTIKRLKVDMSVDRKESDVNPNAVSSGMGSTDNPIVRHSELISIWDRWANEKIANQQDNRPLAVSRMRSCLETGDKILDLNDLRLFSLPSQLPSFIETLSMHGSDFFIFPTSWPTTLTTLDLTNCHIYRLPTQWPQKLDKLILKHARVTDNVLQGFPESLSDLDLSSTNIKKLPSLPKNLKRLKATHNPLGTTTLKIGNLPETLEYLDLSYSAISRSPVNYPSNLKELILDYNHLSKIKISAPKLERLSIRNQRDRKTHAKKELTFNIENLPNLKELDISFNRLRSLPVQWPPKLQHLRMENTGLAVFPSNLPPDLKIVNLSNNHLSEFPTKLPPNLIRLNLNGNQITFVPSTIINLPSTLQISMIWNPLDRWISRSLTTMSNNNHYRGPQFLLSIPSIDTYQALEPLQPLHVTIAYWLPPDQAARWNTVAKEANAQTFSHFLDRFTQTHRKYEDADFKQSIAAWLNQLIDMPDLRQKTFAIAQDSTATCADRIICTINDMQKARVTHDVENGVYDEDIPTLVTLGREMFRLEKLDTFARAKVATLGMSDEIAVYLAYQVKLRNSLKLTTVSPKMNFFEISRVTQDDLNIARTLTMQLENNAFPAWFCQWSPWQSTLQRSNARRYEAALAKRERFVSSGDYDIQIKKEIEQQFLPDDTETRSAIGKKIMDDFNLKTFHDLTEHELGERNLRHLLHKFWPA